MAVNFLYWPDCVTGCPIAGEKLFLSVLVLMFPEELMLESVH